MHHQIARRSELSVSVPRMLLSELFQAYLTNQLAGKPSYRNARRIINQFFLLWSASPVEALTRGDVFDWYQSKRTIPAHATKALIFLKAAYNYGIQYRNLTCLNPTRGIKRHRSPKRIRRMRLDEWQRLKPVLMRAKPRDRAYIAALTFTGKRPSEVLWMEWELLDRLRGIWTNTRTKTGEPEEVPLSAFVMNCLFALPRRGPFVFPGKNPEKPLHEASARKIWPKMRQSAGIAKGRSGLWCYDLRRSTSSDLTDADVNLQTVRQVLNHASLEETDRYCVPNVERVRRALQQREEAMLSRW